jgi:hypothetical protein
MPDPVRVRIPHRVTATHNQQLLEAVPLNVQQDYRPADGCLVITFTRLLRTGQVAEAYECPDLSTARRVLRAYDPVHDLPYLTAAERRAIRVRYQQRLPRLLAGVQAYFAWWATGEPAP